VNLRAERATIERQWEELFAAAGKRLGSRPELEQWLPSSARPACFGGMDLPTLKGFYPKL